MNQKLIDNINSICTTRDTLYHLGDLCFVGTITNQAGNSIHQPDYYFSLINPKVIVIRGNHDGEKTTYSIIHDMTIRERGEYIYCQHEPYPKLNINLCGHVHDMWKVVKMGHKYVVNVGVDVWDYKPTTIEQIFQAIEEHRHYFKGETSGIIL